VISHAIVTALRRLLMRHVSRRPAGWGRRLKSKARTPEAAGGGPGEMVDFGVRWRRLRTGEVWSASAQTEIVRHARADRG